ncbi:unnamed protein product [Danaus chrysippus]|uniref:(African queen) hypothetical protein n=1 Tax=Danaus chrysippus TaxID=151541 RepID=A0A8J2VTE2_9NEOP|nr:unnamed protein product [Danaus chrysippus]
MTMSKTEQTLNDALNRVAVRLGHEDSQIEVHPAPSTGANYTSVLYNAVLKNPEKGNINLFAKVALVGQKMRAADPFKIFDTEDLFYKKLINIYKQLEVKHNVPEEHRYVTPKFYESSLEYTKEVMVLEDLSVKGFATYDRLQSITWDFAAKSLENLAKFHALSIAFAEDDPEEFRNVVSKLKQGESFDSLKNYIQNVSATALRVVKEENRERLAKFTTEILNKEVFESYFQKHKRTFITHRDYRQSNQMYRVVDGKTDVVAIDYQTVQTGNPVADVMYFIFTGSDKKFREQYFNKSIEHYYEELCKAFKRFGLNPEQVYSREDFDYELKKIKPVGLLSSIFCLLVITADKENVPKVSEELVFDDFAIDPNDLYIERINDIVEDYIKMGII